MGPTQSTVAWPGCAEERRDHHDSWPDKQGEPNQSMTRHRTDDLTHQQQHLATRAQYPPDMAEHDDDDSHHVSVNPVYEFALCRKIKETFSKGDDTDEPNSHAERKVERPSSLLAAAEEDVWSTSIVSVQPQSLTPSQDESNPLTAELEPETETSDHESSHSTTTVATKHEEAPIIETFGQSECLTQPKTVKEAMVCQDQTEPANENNLPEGHDEVTGTVPNGNLQSYQTTPPSPQTAIPTETKGTQTTPPPHPGDFTLAPPPPPRPLMISVSTPPDETSPGMFYKLSQLPPGVGSYLTDDITLSSPDFESDNSDAGYVHLRGRFGSGGATAAGGAASAAAGACDSAGGTPEVGRRKRSKKKEEKNIEYVLRQLHSLGTPQEKLTAMCKKYTDLHEEQKGLQTLLKQHQRKMNVILRERDQLQTEHNQVVMKKCKLETLCRELQKQNKVVKDESLLRAKEEEEKRKQMSAKFKTSIAEIQQKVNTNHEQNVQLHEENQALTLRLRSLVEKHQDREEQLDKVASHHRHLELRLAETRLQQASAALKEEQELHLKEKEKMLLQATEGKKKNESLEAELSQYKERYEEFQDTIEKSSQTFQKIKSDMDKMGNRIKKLEKEGEQWKNKWETSNKALNEAAEQKSKYEKENHTLQTKVTKLESLCRALQSQLHQTSKATNSSNDPCTEAASSSSSDDIIT